MLDDVEQRSLSEIDAHLRASDPRLARALSRGRTWHLPWWVAVLAVVLGLAAAMPLGWALAGPPGAIEGGLVVAAAVTGCLLQSRYDRRRPPAGS